MTQRGNGRVLIIVENLPVPFDRRVWQESLALRDAGYDVTVICPQMKSYTAPYEVLEKITILRHPLPYEAKTGALGFVVEYGIAFMWEVLLAWKIFLTRGFDVIHACNPPDNIFLVALPFKLFGVRFVFDQHDINPELYIAKYGGKSPLYRVLVLLERLTYATADLVISTNESYRRIAMTRGKKRPEDVVIVRSAPDTTKFKAVDPEPALKEGRDYLVAYLGVMGKQEGVDLLLRSIREIVQRHGRRDILFVLIGGGPEWETLRKLSRELTLEDHVRFTGRIRDEYLLRYLSTADVCVNPDLVNEMNDKSTMNKIMEYMAVGKPIVQFEMTEGRFSAADASLYAAPNDPHDFAEKILELLRNADQRRTMGELGLQRMREVLDWRFSKEALVAAYDKLMSGRSTSATTATPPRR